jgi:hypothetical protein
LMWSYKWHYVFILILLASKYSEQKWSNTLPT